MKTHHIISLHINISDCNECHYFKKVVEINNHHPSEAKHVHETTDELIVTKRTKLIESAVRKELKTCLSSQTATDTGNEVFTNRQAMEYLHVSRSTLQRWRKNGQLPYRKVEGKILYTKSDLKQLLKSAAKWEE